jgi:hypothetical protein
MNLFFCFTTALLLILSTQTETKKYVHQPLFGELSILDHNKILPFYRVTKNADANFVASKLTVRVKTNHNTKKNVEKHLFVEWESIDSPTKNDALILTCKDQPLWELHEGFDAVLVPTSAHETNSMFLPNITVLPDLRCQYIIRYVRSSSNPNTNNKGGELFEGSIVAEGNIEQSFGLLPTQQHLSFTKNRDEMLVVWVSGHSDPPPTVKWGLKSNTYAAKVTGTSSTYSNTDMCNAPANKTGPQHFINPGYIHQVTLAKLPLGGITIYYVVGNDKHGYSKETTFTSRLNETDTHVKFIMYADQAIPFPHIGPAWKLVSQVENDIVNNGYNAFILHPGDLGVSPFSISLTIIPINQLT